MAQTAAGNASRCQGRLGAARRVVASVGKSRAGPAWQRCLLNFASRYDEWPSPDPIDKRLPASDTYDDTRRDPASNETRPLITESTESLGRDSRRHARREPNVDAST